MVDLFIKRPVLSTVISLVIIIAGAISIPRLPVAQYPDLAPPSVTVSAFYTGANAATVETAVTNPLEQAINGAEGLRYMTSTSGNDGGSNIIATFELTRNLDIAAVEVQNRISQVLGRLPNEVTQTGVSVTKNSAGFLLAVGFYDDGGQYDPLFLSNYLDVYVRDALKRVPGVGNVMIFGERRYAMRLWLDPVRLAGRSMTAADVVGALREQNLQVAAGSVGQSPAPATQAYTISVRAAGRLTEPAEFENIVVRTGTDGALVRVRDVGRVELGAEQYGSRLRYNGFEGVGLGIQQLPTANALALQQAVLAELERLSQRFPPGLKYQVALDTTLVVRESIRDVVVTLIEAILLVVLVMFVFLQDWRSTIIPAVTIPVSLVGTFAFVELLGFSINTLTLFGITLATGIVVDDAIVVVENIQRHIHEEGRRPLDAAVVAMREISGAVVAIALVLAAVFVPVAFFPGTAGRLYQQFSLTIAVSVILSAVNALTLTPALSALMLGRAERPKGLFFRGFNRVFDSGVTVYLAVLRRLVAWRWAVEVTYVALVGLTVVVYRAVPTGFLPTEDQGYFMVLVQAPEGSSLERTVSVQTQVEAVLAREEAVRGAFAVAGFSFAGSGPNRGMMFVRLTPIAERRDARQSAGAILNRVRGALVAIPGAMVVAFPPPPIQGLGAFGGFEMQLLDETNGPIQGLADAAGALMAQANRSGRVAGLFTGFTANDPQLQLDIDRDRAKSLRLQISDIADTLQTFVGSRYVNDFDFNNRSYRVYVQVDSAYRMSPADLTRFYVRSATGAMVPLDTVVRVRETTAPQTIAHYNLFRSATLQGNAAPGVSSGQAIQAMQELARTALPPGYAAEFSGQSLEELRAGTETLYIFGLALALVYLTLAGQYESFVLPFIILLAVPLAVLGAVGAQGLRGLANDVYAQIGLTMLIGLAAKNSILIVEFAEQLREQGMSIADAAIEASRLRLRPILMTSFAFILGVLPLVVATGAGQAARHAVGTSVFGGMLVSTLLNVVFIPVLYVIVRSIFAGGTRRAGEIT